MKIEEIMTRQVIAVPPDLPLKAVAALLAANGISGVPVCTEAGHVAGVVSEADILRKEEGVPPKPGRVAAWIIGSIDGELRKVRARTAAEAMTAPAVCIGPDARVQEAARLMVDRRINRLPVVEDGALVGIVTRADLVRVFCRSDEELEHEIRTTVLHDLLWVDGSVEVAVADGVVSLRGLVDTHSDAEVAERCTQQVPGVVEVKSELTWKVDDQARSARARQPRRLG